MNKVRVIGGGLAGAEAAWQIARCGVEVELYEMKPNKYSPAHHIPGLGELVCSNSFRSNEISNAVGLLKEEMRLMGSLIIEAAYMTKVPAGSALAVNRYDFSDFITKKIKNHPLITLIEEEVDKIDHEVVTVVATGPLSSPAISNTISQITGGSQLHFFDAAAPIVDFTTINTDIAFYASRYNKGDASDYLNCPMTKEQYDVFYNALISAKTAPLKDFDKEIQEDLKVFEGCMPIEVMASRGYDTLRYGPLKPVGLVDPSTGNEAYATVQLRRENVEGTMYNIVGFQTHLTFGEQKRVFSLIPGLEHAEFYRYGVMHRNTYINSPGLLTPVYSMVKHPNTFFAGQMTGVEGYVESASSGFVAGINAAMKVMGKQSIVFPTTTQIGALAHYISEGGTSSFQPMNANFGIIAPFDKKIKGGKKARNEAYAARSIDVINKNFAFLCNS